MCRPDLVAPPRMSTHRPPASSVPVQWGGEVRMDPVVIRRPANPMPRVKLAAKALSPTPPVPCPANSRRPLVCLISAQPAYHGLSALPRIASPRLLGIVAPLCPRMTLLCTAAGSCFSGGWAMFARLHRPAGQRVLGTSIRLDTVRAEARITGEAGAPLRCTQAVAEWRQADRRRRSAGHSTG
jgi:hypothetical protein